MVKQKTKRNHKTVGGGEGGGGARNKNILTFFAVKLC